MILRDDDEDDDEPRRRKDGHHSRDAVAARQARAVRDALRHLGREVRKSAADEARTDDADGDLPGGDDTGDDENVRSANPNSSGRISGLIAGLHLSRCGICH